jgi:hypothetical protein
MLQRPGIDWHKAFLLSYSDLINDSSSDEDEVAPDAIPGNAGTHWLNIFTVSFPDSGGTGSYGTLAVAVLAAFVLIRVLKTRRST